MQEVITATGSNCSTGNHIANERIVSGTFKDAAGIPLQRASIFIRGT